MTGPAAQRTFPVTLAAPAAAQPPRPSAAQARLHLVEMPWHALGIAPLALALLRGTLARTHPGVAVTEHYCNIRWAEYLLDATGGKLTPRHYQDVADKGIPLGLGDWVFSGVLYDDPDWRTVELLRFTGQWDLDLGVVLEMRALAEDFVETAAAEIAAARPDMVGFTTTFMQNLPSLALAKRLKRKCPDTKIIFGGANCDGAMGAALHRNHPFVDFVVRGEAEAVLPLLVDRITDGAGADGLDGVCWWSGSTPVANPQLRPAVPAELIPEAGYDAWHQTFTRSPVREFVAPYLVVEGSRGCWWGQVHHCTFCGLNDATIEFRAKPPERLWSELAGMVQRYQILDVVTSDNIMSVDYFSQLLPRIAQAGWDLRIHYEAKANVRPEQISRLADAGVTMVQFGIENLSTRVLKLMDKGTDGPANVRVLRDCADHGVSVAWNYLYGFPGESPADYWPVIRQMPALVHLEPPAEGAATRIALERFSPYFERPELGFTERRPAAFYHHVYDLPPAEMRDIAYYFDCDDLGISGDAVDALNKALGEWAEAFPESYLQVESDDGDALVIHDARRGWPQRAIELTGWQKTAYQALRRTRSPASLLSALARADAPVDAGELGQWLHGVAEQGLVFGEGGRWVALATSRAHAKLAKSGLR